ncbi:hypothetical protein VP01_6737g1 [Puccinia sorghi]|uniref:Uncharacterized protein n=1 Tax=Puccinia sorghi TaxID=27349 RepID=A0A0L6UEP0_9BASI|nr:hypothetical protein VP01_6737g1 [Puccinia sorghi]
MILEPTLKTTFWKNHKEFIHEYYGLTVAHIIQIFCNTAESFANNQNGKKSNHHSPQPPETRNKKSFFTLAPSIEGIQAEIQHHLHVGPEPTPGPINKHLMTGDMRLLN